MTASVVPIRKNNSLTNPAQPQMRLIKSTSGSSARPVIGFRVR
ncbi:MAG: hypothetical protein QOF92_2747 [Pseudonocardiales bacterium]|jgi:hypothetical protein|nr:hypothetical protein [Pseudonocardiales bacterium]